MAADSSAKNKPADSRNLRWLFPRHEAQGVPQSIESPALFRFRGKWTIRQSGHLNAIQARDGRAPLPLFNLKFPAEPAFDVRGHKSWILPSECRDFLHKLGTKEGV